MSILHIKEAPIRFGDDYGWPQNLQCPNCGGDYLHPGEPVGRITIPFRCEGCDAVLLLGLRFHEGLTLAGWTYSPDED